MFLLIASQLAMYLAIFLHVPNLDADPQISFKDIYLNKVNGKPFNLTADVTSSVPLTSLFWLPPEYSAPLPNRTITFNHGNITTATFMLLKNASVNDTGWYTLTAVNKCGQKLSAVFVEVDNCK